MTTRASSPLIRTVLRGICWLALVALLAQSLSPLVLLPVRALADEAPTPEATTPADPDTTPPVVLVPGDLTAQADPASETAVVEYAVSAEDDIDGAVAVACDWPSGSAFPVGATTVTCLAADAAGNEGNGSFTVTVDPPPAPTDIPPPAPTDLPAPTETIAPPADETSAPTATDEPTPSATPTLAPTPADTAAPTVALTAPTANARISGTLHLIATADDGTGSGVAEVVFQRGTAGNWEPIATQRSAPYEVSALDVSDWAAGVYDLRAVATDEAGNTAASATVRVYVNLSAPTITSDKDDYVPGEAVKLTGANWLPGETVYLNVNDDEGQTWKRDVNVVANANGEITDAFNLPDWFVATYTVKAIGAQSGTVTVTFTDSISYGSTSTNSTPSGGATNITLSRPGTVAVGDALVAQITYVGASALIGAPTGFTQLSSTDGTNIHQLIFVKVATASEPASYTWNFGGASKRAAGALTSYQGTAASSPSNGAAGASGTGVTLTAPSISIALDPDRARSFMVVTFFGIAATATLSTPASMTQRYMQSSASPLPSIMSSDVGQFAAGATGTRSSTSNVSGAWVAQTIALEWDQVNTGGSGGGAVSSLNQTKPADATEGDLLLANIMTRGGTSAITAPAGWTLIAKRTNTAGTSTTQATYWKIAGASEPASYTWSFSPSVIAAGGIVAYADIDPLNPIDSFATNPVTDTSVGGSFNLTAPSVTTTSPNAIIVSLYVAASTATIGPPPGMVSRYSAPSGQSVLAAADTLQAVPGASGTKVAASSASTQYVAQTIALRPKSTGPTKLAFTTAARSGAVNDCLGPITIQTQNANDIPTNVLTNTTVGLATDGTGAFFSDAACAVSAGTSVVIATGSNAATFFYKPTARNTGSHTLTASATGLTSASQAQAVATASQTIVFATLADKTYGDAPFAVSATGGGSGNPVSFSVGATDACASGGANGATITLTGAGSCTVTAAQAGNNDYSPAPSVSRTFTIAPKPITGSFTAATKVYDGATGATVLTRSLAGKVGSDDVVMTGGTAAFATKNVGAGKTVTLTGATLAGANAGNYTLSSVSTALADITARGVIGSITANDKGYDGSTAATLSGSALAGAVAGDDVALVVGPASFADKQAGTGKTVTAGLSLSGADAANYTVNPTATDTADIAPRPLLVTAAGQNKGYDGTTAATVTLSDDRVSGDVLTLAYANATFADKHVGSGKTVSVSGISVTGADAGNYTANTTATTTADITARTLAVSAAGIAKVYDGTTAASVTLTDNRLSGDDLTTSYASASFADKNAGTGKPVAVSGIAISGADATNYTANTTALTSADITPLAITGAFTAQSKIYDGATAATVLTRSLDGAIAGDDVALSGGSAAFDTKAVGTGKTVTLTGTTLSGSDAANYLLTTVATTTAAITPLGITIDGAVARNKTYDGVANATVDFTAATLIGIVSGDDVGIGTGGYLAWFDTRNVGSGKPVTVAGVALSGADAGNYTLAQPSPLNANITPLTITGAFTAANKVYDGTIAATATNRSLSGVLAGDDVALSGGTASFVDKNAGIAKTVTLSGAALTGADAGNYALSGVDPATADITPKALTGAITADDKVYDGTTAATLSGTSLAGVVGSDDVSLVVSAPSFATKTASTGKTVSAALGLSGGDAGNYSVNAIAIDLADITPRPITGRFSAADKVYDGTTGATALTRSLLGAITGDDIQLSGGAAAFTTKTAGAGKTVTLTGVTLAGTDASNYLLSSVATASANIAPRSLVVAAAGQNKVYDGTTIATVTLSDNRITGDALTLGYAAASFADKNVGTGKPVAVSGIAISGADAGNYSFNTTASTVANITPRAITVAAYDQQKTVGSADPSLTYQVTSGSMVAGDAFTGALARDPGEAAGNYAITQGTLSAGPNYTLTFVPGTLRIGSAFGGFLQPINYTAHSVGVQPDTSIFKAGSTVPVKFVLKDAAGNVLPCSGTALWVGYVKGGPTTSPVNEAVFTDPATGGGTYTCSNGVYQFNWSTKGLQAGYYYRIGVQLASGETYYVYIGLK